MVMELKLIILEKQNFTYKCQEIIKLEKFMVLIIEITSDA